MKGGKREGERGSGGASRRNISRSETKGEHLVLVSGLIVVS